MSTVINFHPFSGKFVNAELFLVLVSTKTSCYDGERDIRFRSDGHKLNTTTDLYNWANALAFTILAAKQNFLILNQLGF